MTKNIKIVVIGGGTGSFTLLSALRDYSENITAIVNMADDGGSTGVLRDELGVLPSGDVRQCLVALSDTPKLRDLFNYRFEKGTLKGHSFGNLFLSALEKTTGNFAEAVETASEILNIRGAVVPATLDNVRLKMKWDDESLNLHGERVIDAEHFKKDPRLATLELVPRAVVNPAAISAIEQADLVVIAPGDLYTSLGPLLVIDGIGQALQASMASKIYVCNLVTKQGQTDYFSVQDHAGEIERFAESDFLDGVLYNDDTPDPSVFERYQAEHAYIVKTDSGPTHYQMIAGKFLGKIADRQTGDTISATRSLIRHDTTSVANSILSLYHSMNES